MKEDAQLKIKPKWYQIHVGLKSALPRSERQGVSLAQAVLAPMQAQIALFFGREAGDLEVLQEGVMALSEGEAIICERCKADIFKPPGHDKNCAILAMYMRVLGECPEEQQDDE